MKKIYLCIIIFTLISCSNDDSLSSLQETIKEGKLNTSLARAVPVFPENQANPYDYAGQIYTQLFDSYFDSQNVATTVPDIINSVEAVATGNSNFAGLKKFTYLPITSQRVSYFLLNESTCAATVLSSTSMSAVSKASLLEFINSFVALYQKDATDVALYDFVVGYELEIVGNGLLSVDDKTKILVTTSIARHSVARIKKRPKKNNDPDWDMMVGNIVAGSDGTSSGIAEAITYSLVAGISQNNAEVNLQN